MLLKKVASMVLLKKRLLEVVGPVDDTMFD